MVKSEKNSLKVGDQKKTSPTLQVALETESAGREDGQVR